MRRENAELVDRLTKNFGFAMGIEFREGSLSITPTCDAIGELFILFFGFFFLQNN